MEWTPSPDTRILRPAFLMRNRENYFMLYKTIKLLSSFLSERINIHQNKIIKGICERSITI